jgi:hypothetical protein
MVRDVGCSHQSDKYPRAATFGHAEAAG